MTVSKIQITSDCVARARGLYDEPITVDDADKLIGSSTDLVRHLLEWSQKLHNVPHHSVGHALMPEAAETIAAMEEAQAAYEPSPPETQIALAERLHNSVERGLAAIDRLLEKIDPANERGVERCVRTLAAVAHTLREIAVITRPQKMAPQDEAGEDPIPRDIDEFRRELTRRVQKFVDAEQNGAEEIPVELEDSQSKNFGKND